MLKPTLDAWDSITLFQKFVQRMKKEGRCDKKSSPHTAGGSTIKVMRNNFSPDPLEDICFPMKFNMSSRRSHVSPEELTLS
ncbi:hypothetical protein V6N13_110767 [Hibiscus sabdariffa]